MSSERNLLNNKSAFPQPCYVLYVDYLESTVGHNNSCFIAGVVLRHS